MTENEKSMSELWKDFKQPIISVTGVPQTFCDQKANKQKHQTKQKQNNKNIWRKKNPKFLNLMKRIKPNIKETQQI